MGSLHVPVRERHREQFLRRAEQAFRGTGRVNPEKMAQAVLKVLARRISPGEIEDVRRMLPRETEELWPQAV